MQTSTTQIRIVNLFIFAVSLTILIIDCLLISWYAKSDCLTFNPNVSVSNTPSNPTNENSYTIADIPSVYKPAGLILNLVSGAGGTIDGLLLFGLLYFLTSDQPRYQQPAKRTWLWRAILFVAIFSVGRSLAGFIGSFVEYYNSAQLVLPSTTQYPDLLTDAHNRYIAPHNGGFSFGAWVCQLEKVLIGDLNPGDSSRPTVGRSTIGGLCRREQAGRGLSVVLLVLYVMVTVMLAARYQGERKTKKSSVEDGKNLESRAEALQFKDRL